MEMERTMNGEKLAEPPRMKGRAGIIVLAGTSLLLCAAAGVFWTTTRRQPTMTPPPGAVSQPRPADLKGVSASSRGASWHSWPAQEQVVGPPGGLIAAPSAPTASPEKKKEESRPAASRKLAEPAAPTTQELKTESLRTPETLSPSAARAVLMDPMKSSTLKLAVLEKLRSGAPEETVPVLVAFLGSPGGAATAYTKPTAVRLLADLKHPLADDALANLSQTSRDEGVRLTIAALRAKEGTR